MKTAFSPTLLFLVPAVLMLAGSCSSHNTGKQKDFILTEKDLIPEGLAFDAATQTIYLSSTWKKKIVAISSDGRVSDFITEGQYDIKSVLGMEVDSRRNSLWIVSSEAKEVLPLKQPGPEQWRSSVYQLSLTGGRLIKKYFLDKDSIFLNDITVGEDGSVYVTECMQNAIYKIAPGDDSLELFVQLKPYTFINGICFTDKEHWLYASSTEGIIAIDLNTRNYSILPGNSKINPAGIDGLSFTDNYFIGHQSTKVCRFYLSPGRDSITFADTLSSGKEFDSSTTGETGNGYYYFIVNSQIRTGVDYKKQAIKPLDSLDNIVIRRIKL